MSRRGKRQEDRARAWLEALGATPGDPRLADTPRIMTSFFGRFLEPREAPELSLFPAQDPGVVAVRGLRFYSLCEHHLLPFFGHVDVAYEPEGQVAGFGGIQRCLTHLATRLQLQERLTAQLADLLHGQLLPRGLIVVSRARQLCLEMTGGSPEVEVTVTTNRGDFERVRKFFDEK